MAPQPSYVRSVTAAPSPRMKGLSGRKKGGSSSSTKHSKGIIAEDKKAMHRVNER